MYDQKITSVGTTAESASPRTIVELLVSQQKVIQHVVEDIKQRREIKEETQEQRRQAKQLAMLEQARKRQSSNATAGEMSGVRSSGKSGASNTTSNAGRSERIRDVVGLSGDAPATKAVAPRSSGGNVGSSPLAHDPVVHDLDISV